MSTRSWGLALILSGCLLIFCASPSFPYYAPIQNNVQAWVDADGVTVHLKVYDPLLATWVEKTWQNGNQISNLQTREGIVAWAYRANNGLDYLVLAAYNPVLAHWDIDDISPDNWNISTPNIVIQDGVVVAGGGGLPSDYVSPVFAVYDNGWRVMFGFTHSSFFNLQTRSGIVTWVRRWEASPSIYLVYYVYDPAQRVWQGGEVNYGYFGVVTPNVDAMGTVTWTAGGVNYRRGYNATTKQWYDGPTLPLACFTAQPSASSGAVWFTDMSIGGTSWNMNFGDGTSNGVRSQLHIFGTEGSFTVTQMVTGSGSNATTRSVTIDKLPPSGNISINGGAPYTNSSSVTLQLSATDLVTGVTGMRFSDDGTTWPATWRNYATTFAYTLPIGDGNKTVYVQFKDGFGNISSPVSASIILDTTPPSSCSISINAGANYTKSPQVTLALSATDITSGIDQMRFSNNPSDPTSWTAWKPYATSYSPWVLTSGDGLKTVGAQFKDVAGNVASTQSTITLDSTAPGTCSIVINADAAYTNTPQVTLALSATDGTSSVSLMRFHQYDLTHDSSWTDWVAYTTSKPWTLFAGDGRKWVEAQFQDSAGNISYIVSDTIIIDATSPTDGTLTAIGGVKQVDLNWSGFADAVSGIKTYILYYSTQPFTNIADATKIYDGLALSYSHSGLLSGKTYYYRLCAMDNADNISPGAAANARTKGKVPSLPFLMLLLGN
jgi:hypothetical protein